MTASNVKPALSRTAHIISQVLRWGVIASLALIVMGTVLSFAWSDIYGAAGGTPGDLSTLIAADREFHLSLAWLCQGVLAFDGPALAVLGLVLLVATPVMRVVISIVGFAVERDRTYVAITACVLVLLVLSFVLGRAG